LFAGGAAAEFSFPPKELRASYTLSDLSSTGRSFVY
jgi:hypothetical protein